MHQDSILHGEEGVPSSLMATPMHGLSQNEYSSKHQGNKLNSINSI